MAARFDGTAVIGWTALRSARKDADDFAARIKAGVEAERPGGPNPG